MKHLIDNREPITTADIDQAIRDADALLGRNKPIDVRDLIARLAAIAVYTYGDEPSEAGTDDD